MQEELIETPIDAPDTPDHPTSAPSAPDLSVLLIHLLKNVLYRDSDERLWAALLNLQARVRDYVVVLNLDLVLDEAEGYAFLKSRNATTDAADEQARAMSSTSRLPRLMARRPLSFSVSLMLALLRKKLAEFDAGGSDTRLVLGRDDIVDMVRVFLPDASNEAKLMDQIQTTMNKVVDLGFLHKLKSSTSGAADFAHYEVRRILKAFVDAQWLSELDAQLAHYQSHLQSLGEKEKA